MNKFIPFSKTQKSIRHFALAIVAWIMFALNANAQIVSVPVTGFNNDIVANGGGAINTPNTGLLYPAIGIDGGAYALVTQSYTANGATPSTCWMPTNNIAPSLLTPGLNYSLQDYSSNNALTIISPPGTYVSPLPTNGTLTLPTPASFAKLYFLLTSVNNNTSSPNKMTVVVTFTDLTTETFNSATFSNWFAGSVSTTAFYQFNRVKPNNTGFENVCTAGNYTLQPNMFEYSVNISSANYGKLVSSISFTNTSVSGTPNAANKVNYLQIMSVGGMLPCVTPTAQPTSPILTTISTSQISGSFTTAVSAPSGYLVVRYPAGSTEVLPTNGTTYTVNQSLGLGKVVQASAATSFTNTGLPGGTAFDFYVYSYNNTNCGGGPLYLTTGGSIGPKSTNSCGTLTGTIPIGPSAPASPAGFPNLTAALVHLNVFGLGGHTIFELQADYDTTGEALPFVFSNNPCINNTKTLTIRPAAAVASPITFSNSNTTGVFVFDSGNYITIDGRKGGTGTDKFIRIVNTSSSVGSAGHAVLLKNDANNILLTYLDLQASNLNPASNVGTATAGAMPGVVVIGSTSGTNGNDNNTISFCDIHSVPSTGNLLNVGVYASGTAIGNANNNDNNTINGNNIYDCFNSSSSTAGILILLGNNNFTITNNSYYANGTTTYTYSGPGTSHRGFWIAPGNSPVASSGYIISGNYIGGTEPLCGGSAYTMPGAVGTVWFGMDITVGTLSATNIYNNTIRNIDFTTTNSGNYFNGFNIATGTINIGLTPGTGNTIGSDLGNGSITINNSGATTSTGNFAFGIRIGNTGNLNVNYNTIGSITINNGGISTNFSGISTQGSGTPTMTINNNLIGSETTANSIQTTGAGAPLTGMGMSGIYITTGVSTSSINNNTIKNLHSSYSGTASLTVFGLRAIDVATSTTTITGNFISNLSSASATIGSGKEAAICAISQHTQTASTSTVSGNKIHSLKLTNPATSVAIQIVGILVNPTSAGAINMINGNELHSFSLDAINNSVTMTAIACSTNAATYSNNMIRLGIDALGNSVTTGVQFRGFTKGAAEVNNFYHNSVYIGGTHVITSSMNSFAFQRGNTTANDQIVNNIFVNNRSNDSIGGKHFSISVNVLSAMTVNYNDYYGTGNGYVFGAIAFGDIPLHVNNWIAGDLNSYALDPEFENPEGNATTVDLHIDGSTPTVVEGTGTQIAAVTNDFDNLPLFPRTGLTPTDIGADAGNFISLQCSGTPQGGTASLSLPGVICTSGTKTLILTGFTNYPGITFQWQESSTPGGPYVNVTGGTGATTTIFTTPTITTSTYYVCKVTCSNGNTSSLSSEILVVVTTPQVIQTVPNDRCGAGPVVLNATPSSGATLNWYSGPTGGTATPGSPFTTPTIAVTTTFYVSATIVSQTVCESARTPVIATINNSIPVLPVATKPIVCLGSSSEVSVTSANDPNYDYIWSGPGGFTANGPGPHVVTPTGSGTTYQVYAYDSSTSCGALQTVVVNTSTNNLSITATSTPASVCYGSNAQLNVNAAVPTVVKNYTLSAFAGSFTPLSGATTAPGLNSPWDTGNSTAIPVPFTFNYSGTGYTSIIVTNDGLLMFGTGRIGTASNSLSASGTHRPSVVALWDDLKGTVGVKYQVSGTTPNRVMTVEWLNMKWGYTASAEVISFQVKLYENSNIIDFIYKQEPTAYINASGGASIGLMGTAANEFISVQNTSASPTTSTTASTDNISTKPATGQVYRFTPPQPGLLNYVWTTTNGTPLSSNTISNPIVSAMTANESFSVLVTDQVSGCQKTATVNVTVKPVPVPQLSGNAAVCENDQLTLSAFDGTSYNWTGPNNYNTTTTGNAANGSSVSLFNMQEINEGNYTVTVTNSVGCTSSETMYYYVNDRPELTLASMTPVSCFGGNNGAFVVGVTGGSAPYTLSESYTGESNGDGIFDGLMDGTYEVTITDDAIPSCASVMSLMVTVPTVPNIAPALVNTATSLTVECDGSGNTAALNAWLADNGGATATDVCTPSLTWSNNFTSLIPSCGSTGTVTVTFTATDDHPISPLSVSTTATFTIEDTQAPTITAASNSTVECDGAGNTAALNAWLANHGGATASDICSGVTWTSNFTSLSDLCGSTGSATVTFTATDACGNAASSTATFTIVDTTNPAITAASSSTVECDGAGNTAALNAWIADNGGATASDACSGVTWSNNFTSLSDLCGTTGSATVTFTATDACGNASSSTATFTIVDTTNPTITAASSSTVECDGAGNTAALNAWIAGHGGATASDACSGVTWSNNFTSLSDLCGATGSATVTFIATDACGNASSSTATFTIVDTTAPVIVCPSNITVNNTTNQCGTNVNYTATASDVCSGSATVAYSIASGSFFAIGTTTVTATATDACGNTSSCSFTVTVNDNQVPVINCPASVTIPNEPAVCGAAYTYAVTGSDNCAYNIVMTGGIASGQVFPIGTTINTFVMTDASGNTSTCSFSVTVNDTQAPYLAAGSTCPSSFTACNPVSWIAPVYTDNCPGVQVTSTHTPGTIFPEGVTLVTYTATDLKGNVSTCSFNVSVLDTSEAATSITSNRDYNNICSGGDITLTVNGGHLGEVTAGVPAQWKWYSGSCGGTLVGTGASITVAPTVTTTYYVRPVGACNTPACVSLTVVVNTGAPTATPVYNILPSFGAPGVTSTLSVNPVPGATFYRWFTNGGHINSVLFDGQLSPHETSLPTTQVSFVLPEQNYQIRVLAGNACGRSSQSNTHIRGTVSSPASMSGPTQVCPGSPVTYTIPVIPPVSGNSPVTYSWSLVPSSAGTISVSANGLTATVNFAFGFGTAQVCANGISSFGLPGAPYCLTVTSSAPVPGAVSGNATPCINNTYTYSIASVPNAASYNWTTTAGTVQSVAPNGLSAVILFQNSAFTNKTVCVTASSTCGTSAPSCITVSSGTPADPGDINGPSSGVCGVSNVTYSLATSNANSYQWAVTSGMSMTQPTTNNSVNVSFLPGFTTGTVSVTAYYSCGSVVKTFNVSGAPQLPVILPSAVCPNTSQSYFITNAVPGDNYSWVITGDISDSACANMDCNEFIIDAGNGGGSYAVTATNACGTVGPVISGTCRIAAPTMIMEIYPNPTSGMLTVDFSGINDELYQITVTDLSGRVIMAQELKAVSGRNHHQIDLGFANAGLYMIYLKNTSGEISVQKIAVE